MNKTTSPLIVAAALLAGCGGSGGGDECAPGAFCDITQDLADTLSKAGLDDAPDTSGAVGAAPTSSITDFEDLPTAGDANYSGQLALQIAEGELIVGNTDITVVFSDTGGSLSGDASGFVGETTGVYTGGLTISEGVIYRGSETFLSAVQTAVGDDADVADETDTNENVAGIVADVSGTLTASNANETTLDGSLIGAFSGENADIVGLTVGTAVSDDSAGEFAGVLIAVD